MKLILEVKWKNKRSFARDLGSKRGRGTTNQLVFGILCRSGMFGPGLLKMLELILFDLLSQKKLLPFLLFVLIPGELIPESRHEVTFIVSSIMVKNNTQMEKETILMVLRDFGGI
jgi:hypothetical protein